MYYLVLKILSWITDIITDIIIYKKNNIDPHVDKYVINPIYECLDLNYKRFNIVKDNVIIKKSSKLDDSMNLNFDFILEKNENSNLTKIHYPNDNFENTLFTLSTFKFLSFSIKTQEDVFDIDFEKSLNFMCENNYFDKIFFNYYVFEKYNKVLPNNYEINFITNKMDMQNKTQDLKFKIENNNYIIL